MSIVMILRYKLRRIWGFRAFQAWAHSLATNANFNSLKFAFLLGEVNT